MKPQTRELDTRVSVGGQISPADIPALAAAGFRCIICNRPDGEELGQPRWRDIADAARAHGMTAHYVPLAGRTPTPEAVDGFAAALAEADGKVFAYCRTGARCENLWRQVRMQRAA